jgi:hypothetical protein
MSKPRKKKPAAGDPIPPALQNLIKAGKIIDSGERRNGQIVYIATPVVH